MRRFFATAILLIIFSVISEAQIKYAGKVETGYLKYLVRPIVVDAGPGWRGYNLDKNQNGIDLNFINGISSSNGRGFVGVGVGYLNFEGINGISLFSDFENVPLRGKFSPILNLKIGYTHIWNQYDGGRGSGLVEFGIGEGYKVTEKLSIFLKSGLLITQQSVLIPIRMGVRF